MTGRWLMTSAITSLSLAASVANAQVALKTEVESRRVEVGQPFSVQLSAMVSGGDANLHDPKLKLPAGVTARGPSVGSKFGASFVNGRVERQTGITATWVLVASVTGRLKLGPAQISLGNRAFADRPVEVEVVDAGSLPRRGGSRGRPGSLFDLFEDDFDLSGPLFPPLPGLRLPEPPVEEQEPSWPTEYNQDRALDPIAFLDARVTPTRVVIGEQVTYQLYAYGHPGPFQTDAASQPNRQDFLTYSLDDPSQETSLFRIRIGQEPWFAARMRSEALFPLRTGKLVVGSTRLVFNGQSTLSRRGYVNVTRESKAVEIRVEEPPLAGRPSGYRIGDVGQFTLKASVEPRRIRTEQAVSVTLELEGTGLVPQRLQLPEQSGVDWLEPAVSETTTRTGGRIGGSRQFVHVVRFTRPGHIELGAVRLPFFNPETRRYAVAKAELGTVEVLPGNTPQTAAPPAPSATPFDMAPRGHLGPVPSRTRYLADQRSWWFATLAGPLLLALAFASVTTARTVGRWVRGRRQGLDVQIQKALAEAQAALGGGRPTEAASPLERAIHLGIEAATGLRSRAILQSELLERLTQAGQPSTLAQRVVELLKGCDELRFLPNPEGDAAALLKAAAPLLKELMQRRPPTSGGAR